jgi:hypothetical protein
MTPVGLTRTRKLRGRGWDLQPPPLLGDAAGLRRERSRPVRPSQPSPDRVRDRYWITSSAARRPPRWCAGLNTMATLEFPATLLARAAEVIQ